jgi:hypothetical protein
MTVVTKKAAAAKGITAWSYSRLNSYETCPFKFKLTVIDGLKEPGSLAMDRGSAIHAEGEAYLKNQVQELPASYKLLAEEMETARKNGVMSELEITFTKEWTPTGWFDADAWLRIKIDMYYPRGTGDVVRIDDIKTGKNRGGYEDQLELYCLAALIMDPEAKHAEANLLFVDSGEVIGTSHGAYTQKDVPALKTKWEKRVKPMFIDDLWAPSPNQYCRYCYFRNGGPGGSQCTY